MLGEKGIGRLSIAAIGPQALVMTRAWQPHGASALTVAFVNWSVFEWPSVTLSDIDIPVRVIPNGLLPTKQDVENMVDDFRTTCRRFKSIVSSQHMDKLNDDLSRFRVDPLVIDSYCPRLTLRGARSGTHFVLLPTSNLLPKDIDGDSSDQSATPLQKGLLGFRNTMVPDAKGPDITISFRDHRDDDAYEDIVEEGEFFTREQFANADHQFVGRFDEHGQFKGAIHIYGDHIDRRQVPWRNIKGIPTKCGPFDLHLAVVERQARSSTLTPDEHVRMTRQMSAIGGLYIYRDGIRILPYGNTDYDWLGIEYRRTKGAGYYYFSHRKMFGAIQLTTQHNVNLKEKAGREGFLENVAYREFKDILRSFLLQVSADHFRTEGTHADVYRERQAEITADRQAAARRQKYVRVQRKQLAEHIDTFFRRMAADTPTAEVATLAENVEKKVRTLEGESNIDRRHIRLQEIEQRANAALRDIQRQYKIVRPRIALPKTAQAKWERYRTKYIDLSINVFAPARHLLDSLLAEAEVDEAATARRRGRGEATLEDVATEVVRRVARKRAQVVQDAGATMTRLHDDVKQCLADMHNSVDEARSAFYRTDVSSVTAAEFVDILAEQEKMMIAAGDHAEQFLDGMAAQLDAMDTSGRLSPLDQLVAIEQRNQALEEQLALDLQLAHIGMAVEIINHEFGLTVRTLRNNLRRLKAWADANPELDVLYAAIRTSFDHLDGYLKMFTPLQRRLYRKRIDIRGREIATFLKDLFQARFKRHDILIRSTRAFADMCIRTYPSSIYPVFVNLIDNAIYWLSLTSDGRRRRIDLHAKGRRCFITDNGPGIEMPDRDRIFGFGFSRKPGGRGMGLYIVRETLREIGYQIAVADREQKEVGAMFSIEPAK